MKPLPRKALRILNVLIIVGLLLGAVAPVAGAAERQEVRGEATASAAEVRARTAVVGETNGRVQTEAVSRTSAESAPAFVPPATAVAQNCEKNAFAASPLCAILST